MDARPPDRRALLGLHSMEDIRVDAIASIFRVPEGTVKSRLFTARQTLKSVLDQPNQESKQ